MPRTTCDFSSTEPMCKTLDNAGVPTDGQWRSLVLYLRDLSEHDHRPENQKKQFQQLLLKLIKDKDYSAQRLKTVSHETEQIISAPCLHNLKNAINETAKLLGEFQQLIAQRRGDIQTLETTTISRVESGLEPQLLLGELRTAFHSIISVMDEDIEHLQTLSHRDSLTGLHNRRSLDKHLTKELVRVEREEIPLAIIFLDIDHFKKFNDDFGHRIGDQALATVASIINQSLVTLQCQDGFDSFVSRYGGEEFAIVLTGGDETKGMKCAEFIRQQLENYNFIIRNQNGKISKKNICITASFGVAQLQLDWPKPHSGTLLDAADQAMYQAKKSGRNQVYAHSQSA